MNSKNSVRQKTAAAVLRPQTAVAAACCLLLFGWFGVCARYGFRVPDETFYLTIPQRLLQGDRLLLDEWHLSQLTAIFQILPFAAFTKITGGTDGVILFMRWLYLCADFAVYWIIYLKLREKPWRAILCAVSFCGFVPFAVFALNYYTLTAFFMLLSCLILSGNTSRGRPVPLFFAGCLFAGAVLMTPALAIFYVLYTALAFVRLTAPKKSRSLSSWDFILNIRTWLYFFFGILASASVFLIWLQLQSGIGNIIKNIPNLLSDSEYDVAAGGNVRGFLSDKILTLHQLFRPYDVIFWLLSVGAFLLPRLRRTEAFLRKSRQILFLLSLLLLILACAALLHRQAVNSLVFHSVAPVPLFCFGLACYLLCENKNRRLFLLWWGGLAFSLSKDSLSDISVGFGCVLGVIPAAYHFLQVSDELTKAMQAPGVKRKAFPQKKGRTILKAASVCALSLIILWNGVIAFSEGIAHYYEDAPLLFSPEDARTIRRGPHKGIVVSADFYAIYEDTLSDLDRTGQIGDGPVYVCSMAPWDYMYLGKPYCVYSTWWVHDDAADRQLAYWKLYPEKCPGVIYVPDCVIHMSEGADAYNGEVFERLKPYCRYETVRGKAGTIYLIREWQL